MYTKLLSNNNNAGKNITHILVLINMNFVKNLKFMNVKCISKSCDHP